MPSTVVTAMPSIDATGRRHALTERRTTRAPTGSQLAIITVQAPQPPSPQLSFVPVRPLARRWSMSSSAGSGSRSATRDPLT